MILGIKACAKKLLLLTIYNGNTEKEQLDTLPKLSEMLTSIPNIINTIIILGGDFSLFFDTSIETQCGNPIFKNKSLV